MAKALLAFSGLGALSIAIGYMISPEMMFGLYDIQVTSINERNMVRAAYGGILGGFAILFLLGALKQAFQRPALIALITLMGGAAVARIVSTLVDGLPASPLIHGLLAIEVVTVALAVPAVRRLRS